TQVKDRSPGLRSDSVSFAELESKMSVNMAVFLTFFCLFLYIYTGSVQFCDWTPCLHSYFFFAPVGFREGNEPGDESTVTYRELLQRVCQFANVLKSQGVKKGDRVSIYMPMVVELVVAMLACVRIGAVHSIVFAGFSAESLCERIMDSQCSLLITGSMDGGLMSVLTCWVVFSLFRLRPHVPFSIRSVEPGRGPLLGHVLMRGASDDCEPEWCESEDPLFILYTSGSTGKPKRVHALYRHHLKLVFDHQPEMCHCVLVRSATYPDVSRMWRIVDKYHVTKFYTAPPPSVRPLVFDGLSSMVCPLFGPLVFRYKRESLKAWQWYYTVVGQKRCPHRGHVLQTETVSSASGGHDSGTWTERNHQRFETTYFRKFPRYYVTGDGERQGRILLYTGRIDDMLNVSGHLLSTAEVESALVEHEAVAEAAVVDGPSRQRRESVLLRHPERGCGLQPHVGEKIGAIATPDYIQNAPGLPKTRSGTETSPAPLPVNHTHSKMSNFITINAIFSCHKWPSYI
uniref:acetate--CoA ligase n=1 Tax=Sphaeramia orbicularis TaxID=375764 RepID=A0A672YGK1_9TELE